MTTALVMIARDEARSIERSLRSAREWVDEMIVLDTGSRDATARLAEAAGARVHRFRWIDDFAAARNAALAHSAADWNLVLDADEWLLGEPTALRGLCAASAAFVGLVDIANEFDSEHGPQVSHSRVPRLLPRGIRYAGRIHEQPQSTLPRRATGIVVGHDGYRAAGLRRKRGRNLRLLEAAIEACPADAYLQYQLGKELCVYERFDAACERFERAAVLAPLGARYRHDLIVRRLYALKKCARHPDAVQVATAEMAAWTESPDFHFALGDLLLDWAAHDPQRAGELLPMVEAAWRRCLEIGERPELDGAVEGRGSHLAAHNLAILCEGTGRAEPAAAYRALARRSRAVAVDARPRT
jgi:hypothetical protein